MTTRLMHMGIGLDYLEEVIREDERLGKPQEYVKTGDGNPVSYVSALQHINQLRVDGFTVFPTCDRTQPDGRCAGHPS